VLKLYKFQICLFTPPLGDFHSGSATGVRTVQRPVYYINEVLHEAKARYLETHKLLYAVLVASRKLRHYF
jgi:ribonuclease HI